MKVFALILLLQCCVLTHLYIISGSRSRQSYVLRGFFKLNANSFDIPALHKDDFPILQTEAYPGKPLIYLDSGASSQKPRYVLDKMNNYYLTSHANVHRGAHVLAMKATTLYEWVTKQ